MNPMAEPINKADAHPSESEAFIPTKNPIFYAIITIIMFSFLKSMFSTNDVSPEEFQTMIQDQPGLVIDVRTRGEYDAGHLSITDKQLDIMTGEFQRAISDMDKSATYYLYCRTGNRSGQAASMMRQSGFEKVYNIGGFGDLAAAGLETKTSF